MDAARKSHQWVARVHKRCFLIFLIIFGLVFPKFLKFLRIQCSPNFRLVCPVLGVGMIAPCGETLWFLDWVPSICSWLLTCPGQSLWPQSCLSGPASGDENRCVTVSGQGHLHNCQRCHWAREIWKIQCFLSPEMQSNYYWRLTTFTWIRIKTTKFPYQSLRICFNIWANIIEGITEREQTLKLVLLHW